MLGGHPHLRSGTVPTPSPPRHMPPRRSTRGSGVRYRRARRTLSMTTTSTIAATRVLSPTPPIQRSWATRRPEQSPEGDGRVPGAHRPHDSVRGDHACDTARVHGANICHANKNKKAKRPTMSGRARVYKDALRHTAAAAKEKGEGREGKFLGKADSRCSRYARPLPCSLVSVNGGQ